MRPIEKIFSDLPIVLNDFFRYLYKGTPLCVFLCGSKPSDLQYDLREQVRWLLENRMGCKAFLGEEIDEFKNPKVDQDHLTIEVKHAVKSDLVIMFLGTPGTMAEVTAFAMTENVREKTVVFNNKDYHGKKSFINRGPLKLLPKENVIPYDAESNEPTLELVKHLDVVLAKTWYQRTRTSWFMNFNFEYFICLAMIYSAHPIRYQELKSFYPYSTASLNATLKCLFDKHLIKEDEKKYVPCSVLSHDLEVLREHVSDISRVRLKMLGTRLRNEDIVSDYRLIV